MILPANHAEALGLLPLVRFFRQRADATALAEYLNGKRDFRFLDRAMKMEPQPVGGERLERSDGTSAVE